MPATDQLPVSTRVELLARSMTKRYTQAQIDAIELRALDAALEGSLEMSINQQALEGGGSGSGEQLYNPHEVIAACLMIADNVAAANGTAAPYMQEAVHHNFSTKIFAT